MQALYKDYQDRGLVIIGVSTDRNQEDVQKIVDRFQITFPIYWDAKTKTARRYGARSLPTTFLINREGKMVGIATGSRAWNSESARAWIDDLLAVKKKVLKTSSSNAKRVQRIETQDGLQVSIAAPEGSVHPKEAFLVKTEIRFAGSGEQFAAFEFDPPEIPYDAPFSLVTLGTQSFVDQKEQVLRFNIFLMPEDGILAGGHPLGPFEIFYQSQEGPASIEIPPISVIVGGQGKQIYILAGMFVLMMLIGFILWKRRSA